MREQSSSKINRGRTSKGYYEQHCEICKHPNKRAGVFVLSKIATEKHRSQAKVLESFKSQDAKRNGKPVLSFPSVCLMLQVLYSKRENSHYQPFLIMLSVEVICTRSVEALFKIIVNGPGRMVLYKYQCKQCLWLLRYG